MDGGFDEFCEAVWPRLVAGLTHHLGDHHLAEDVAQEALVRAGARWRQVRRTSSPTAWVFRVGANLGISELRRRSAERRAVERLPTRTDDGSVAAEDADLLAVALAALPEQQRRVVVARFYLDLTVAEVAAAFAVSEGAVRATTHRAITRLRADLPSISTTHEE